MSAVMDVLAQLGCAEHSIFCVFNKMDLVNDQSVLPLLRNRFGDGVMVSAVTGDGLDNLRAKIRSFLDRNALTATIRMPASAGRLQAFLAEHGKILARRYEEDSLSIDARIAPQHLGFVKKMGGTVSTGLSPTPSPAADRLDESPSES